MQVDLLGGVTLFRTCLVVPEGAEGRQVSGRRPEVLLELICVLNLVPHAVDVAPMRHGKLDQGLNVRLLTLSRKVNQ